VQGDEVTMRLTYHFVDGSIDDEMTMYKQQNTGASRRRAIDSDTDPPKG
jgi:hypothetical protein